MTQKRVLGIIPARGGSKTIKRKNLVPILNRPLISYTISEGLKSTLLSNVVVSSEDQEIIEAVQLGVNSESYTRGKYSPEKETGVHHFHYLLTNSLN